MGTTSKKDVLNKLLTFSEEEREKFEEEKMHLDLMHQVQQLMAKHNWNKTDLAKKLGTSKSYITQLFRGDKLFNCKLIVKLGNVFNTKFRITNEPRILHITVQNPVSNYIPSDPSFYVQWILTQRTKNVNVQKEVSLVDIRTTQPVVN